MAYADYEFYTAKYLGNVVPETDFPRLAERASDRIDSLTNKRLRRWLPEDEYELNDIKRACCVLAEGIYQTESLAKSGIEQTGTADGRGKVITSVTSGSESVSYATGGASANSLEGQAVQQVIADSEKRAVEYLSGIAYKDKGYPILFRGIGYE